MRFRSRFSLAAVIIAGMLLILGSGSDSDDDNGGGGGGTGGQQFTGNTDPAAIDDMNAEGIGTTAGEAAVSTIEADDTDIPLLPGGVEFGPSIEYISMVVTEAAKAASTSNLNFPAGITFTSDELNAQAGMELFCGGSVTIDDSALNPPNINGSYTYNDLCILDGMGGQATLSGTITFVTSGDQITITYEDLTYISSFGTSTLSGTVVCDTQFLNCEYTQIITTSDGGNHQISGAIVSDQGGGSWTIDATFSHEVYGEVTISTPDPITWGGPCYPFPDSGTINFSSSNGSSGSITFNTDCTYSGSWDDGQGNSGTFNGSFTPQT